MDNIRVFLWLTLLGMAWLTYTAWQADYGAAPRSADVSTRRRPRRRPASPRARFRRLNPTARAASADAADRRSPRRRRAS